MSTRLASGRYRELLCPNPSEWNISSGREELEENDFPKLWRNVLQTSFSSLTTKDTLIQKVGQPRGKKIK